MYQEHECQKFLLRWQEVDRTAGILFRGSSTWNLVNEQLTEDQIRGLSSGMLRTYFYKAKLKVTSEMVKLFSQLKLSILWTMTFCD